MLNDGSNRAANTSPTQDRYEKEGGPSDYLRPQSSAGAEVGRAHDARGSDYGDHHGRRYCHGEQQQ